MMFICGCGHSGTSLLAAMFGAHSQVYAINFETQVFAQGRKPDDIVGFFEDIARTDAADAEVLCEKTPAHVRRIEAIREIYPDAPILIPVRDPRDVCASIKKRTSDLDIGLKRWNKENDIVRRRSEKRGDVIVFRYEDLIEDPQGVLERLCERAAIPFEPGMLDFHKDEREWFGVKSRRRGSGKDGSEHVNLRNWQIHQPLTDHRGRWRNELTREEVERVERESADVMAYFGYAPSAERAAS